jgi:GTP-binding protein
VRIEFKIPTRGLFGIRTEFLSETRGTGLLYHTFLEYGPYRGEIANRGRGALVSKEGGDTGSGVPRTATSSRTTRG